MTYLDLNGNFGALGHGISDSDTGEVVEISQGNLYDTEIIGIEKGTIGNPGVMSGVIYYGPVPFWEKSGSTQSPESLVLSMTGL